MYTGSPKITIRCRFNYNYKRVNSLLPRNHIVRFSGDIDVNLLSQAFRIVYTKCIR